LRDKNGCIVPHIHWDLGQLGKMCLHVARLGGGYGDVIRTC
jgi:hypothetical protein